MHALRSTLSLVLGGLLLSWTALTSLAQTQTHTINQSSTVTSTTSVSSTGGTPVVVVNQDIQVATDCNGMPGEVTRTDENGTVTVTSTCTQDGVSSTAVVTFTTTTSTPTQAVSPLRGRR